jgi:GT2 family glycosyltransferase
MKKRSVSVVIPNYNGEGLLRDYLPYTLKALQNVEEWEVIVVDDASQDGSVKFLRSNFPQVKVIANKINKGFSHSCNCGMQAARFNYVFFQNSDIKLTPDYFEHQWAVFDGESTFGVMGKILEMDSHNIEIAAKYPRRKGNKLKINSQFEFEEKGEFAPTAFLSGANALVDAEKVKKIGGFDEIYSPFYFEDMDMGVRAWRMGWKCYYDAQSICYHLGSVSIKESHLRSDVKQIYFRNRLFLHGIHLGESQMRAYKLQVFFMEVVPKMAMGQFWMWESFREFLKKEHRVKVSREKLRQLMVARHSKIGLFDIIDLMDEEMKPHRVQWV